MTELVLFQPIDIKFNENVNDRWHLNPYCKVKLGRHHAKASVAHLGKDHPFCADIIYLKRKHKEEFASIQVKEKHGLNIHNKLGKARIDLREVFEKGKISQWYDLMLGDKITGTILLDIVYHLQYI